MSKYLQLMTYFVAVSTLSILLCVSWLKDYRLVPPFVSRALSKDKLEIYQNKSYQATDAIEENEDAWQLQTKNSETTLPENYTLEMERRFAARRRQMHVMCRKFGDKLKSSIQTTYAKSYYCPKYDLLVCASRKGGSTTMRKIISNIETGTYDGPIYFVGEFFTFHEYTTLRIKKPIRIAVIRHPFVRLISAFHENYRNGSSIGESRKARRWLDMFLRAHGLENETMTSLNFTMFLQIVIQQHAQTMSVPYNHWQTGVQFCSFCTVDYDYVFQTETLNEDIDYILQMVGERNGEPPVFNKRSVSNDSFAEYMAYYEGVPADVLSAIYDVFKYDMFMFGYELTPYIRNALISQGTEIL